MISRHFPRLPFSHFLPRDWLAQPHNPIQTPITPTTPLPMPSISHPHIPPFIASTRTSIMMVTTVKHRHRQHTLQLTLDDFKHSMATQLLHFLLPVSSHCLRLCLLFPSLPPISPTTHSFTTNSTPSPTLDTTQLAGRKRCHEVGKVFQPSISAICVQIST